MEDRKGKEETESMERYRNEGSRKMSYEVIGTEEGGPVNKWITC